LKGESGRAHCGDEPDEFDRLQRALDAIGSIDDSYIFGIEADLVVGDIDGTQKATAEASAQAKNPQQCFVDPPQFLMG
jgi:hypothetical protein